ncbi:MAG: SAM-dependent methyltransferase [Marinicella sp.]
MSDTLLQINQALQHRITSEIKQKGAISFAQFMAMALYEPGLGYYSAGLNKLGKDGDFITSSELGTLFARCHATVFAEVLRKLSSPILMELGAGTGQFCFDILQALDALQVLPEKYCIVEISADLQRVQQQKLSQLPDHLNSKIHWLERPPEKEFEGIIFANEVIDALPVEIFKKAENKYLRLMLGSENQQLSEKWQPFPEHMAQYLTDMQLDLANGYRSEFLPQLDAWISAITIGLKKGMLMLVDYGYGRRTYYHPQRNTGTLVCQRRHQANFNPYQDIGLQDITAFVDFTAVAESMELAGLNVTGYTTQGDFLLDAGINQWLNPADEYSSYYKLVSEMKQLVLPEEMGEKFKTIVAVKNFNYPIKGYSNSRWKEL